MPDNLLQTLITSSQEEGFSLAVKLAQKGVLTTQPSAEVWTVLRSVYANNADRLIAVSHVIAVYFQTVAANNYWQGWTPYHQY